MLKSEVLNQCREIGLVPVLRAESESQALALASAIAAGGVTVLEVTMTVPGAIRVMRRLAEERPDILIGAGTVLDPETARMCILEGAVCGEPGAQPEDDRDVPSLRRGGAAGCADADRDRDGVGGGRGRGEGVSGERAGRRRSTWKSVKAPLPQVEMIPTGGVSQSTATEFLEAGAFALGVGADLVNPKAIADGHPEVITENAAKYLAIVRRFREAQAVEAR